MARTVDILSVTGPRTRRRARGTAKPGYSRNVFINVPFDRRYRPLLRAVVFAIFDCGFVARSALERQDSAELRLDKIKALIRESKYGVHDISRTTLDTKNRLPRFNMPLELGMFLGAQTFGSGAQRRKGALVLDVAEYRYQKYCSDIAGQDVREHGNSPHRLIREVRDWLRSVPESAGDQMPSGSRMAIRYDRFIDQLPALCTALHLDERELTFPDLCIVIVSWLRANPR